MHLHTAQQTPNHPVRADGGCVAIDGHDVRMVRDGTCAAGPRLPRRREGEKIPDAVERLGAP